MARLQRHDEILSLLKKSEKPLSGAFLAEKFDVSRQIIVKDMNCLKENGHQIISTARGYILIAPSSVKRVIKVFHTIDDTEKELNLIVDQGAEVDDVFIFHKVYGEIHAPLHIGSRKDVKQFVNDILSGKSSPLSTATSGFHYHTISAPDENTLDLVFDQLKENGFTAELTDYEPQSLFQTLN